jgi:uncharacterized membrane protein YagU involved in acid resistance
MTEKNQNKLVLIFKGGLIATGIMTMLMVAAPLMGMPEMRIGNMFAEFLSIPVWLGWVMHIMAGVMLAAIYILVFRGLLPGGDIVKGTLFSLIPFLMAQIMVMPMMGSGIFSSATSAPMMMVMGSLMGHLVYGVALGLSTKDH